MYQVIFYRHFTTFCFIIVLQSYKLFFNPARIIVNSFFLQKNQTSRLGQNEQNGHLPHAGFWLLQT